MSRRSKKAAPSSTKKLAIKAAVAVTLLTTLVGGGLFLAWNSQDHTPFTYEVTEASSEDQSEPNKNEAPLPEKTFNAESEDTYTPPIEPASVALMPSTLAIPSVDISAPIVDGGAESGEMVLPESSKVAQYTGAAPIEAKDGSTVIAGHVNFTDGSWGELGTLHQVQKGAPVYVTDSEGEVHKYQVTEMTVLHKESLPYQIFRTEGERQLVIVTCGGEVENVNGELVYTQNVVVYATPA